MNSIILSYFHSEAGARDACRKSKNRAAILHLDAKNRLRVIATNHWLWFTGIPPKIFGNCPPLLLKDEFLLLTIPSKNQDISVILASLRITHGEQPSTFVVSTTPKGEKPPVEVPQNNLPLDHMSEGARYLARTLIVNPSLNSRQVTPLCALRKTYRDMQSEIQRLNDMAKSEHTLSMTAETLIDNAYVIDGNVVDILKNFPARYYRQLPMVLEITRSCLASTPSQKTSCSIRAITSLKIPFWPICIPFNRRPR